MSLPADLARWESACGCCGRGKRGVPDIAHDAPVHAEWGEAGEPGFRVLRRDGDLSVMGIDGTRQFFIRGVLRLLPAPV